ncbi:MAG: BatA domain-containing protein [Pirellulales bacterium]|nr:BatA domain-containing protein [Pirellulales bacterium]
MSFVNPLLLAGISLIAVPIVLHLVMRRRPRHLEFPALRLVRQRHETNRRQIRLRHLVLLALRIAAIALVAVALARPSLQLSKSLGTWGSREAPVAAALVFDAAPRMEYRQANETRFEAAQKLSEWLLRQLPRGSRIAVLDTRLGAAAFQVDRSAAASRIEQLAPVANSQSLPAVLDEAFRLLARSDLTQKEIYVFTDLARAAWPARAAARLQRRAAELPEVTVYLIDVGVDDASDFGLGELRLSAQLFSSRSPLRIASDLIRKGPAGQRTVELFVLNEKGEPEKRDERVVEVEADGTAGLDFQVSGLGEGAHQGYVRIVGQDGLAADDHRYFSVEVRPPWPILVVDPRSPHADAEFLSQRLAPDDWVKSGLSRFECETVAQPQLAKTELDRFAAVCLVDPKPLAPAEWDKLTQYVSAGGGLAVFLGRNARPVASFNSPDAQRLLPATLLRQAIAPEGDIHLAPRDLRHPILAAFRSAAGSVPWSDMPVFRYWELGKLADGVGVVVPFSDGRPALIERSVGEGRVAVMTTPLSDVARGDPWNLLPVNDPWPLVALTNQAMLYLVGSTEEQLNYFAGQTAMITIDPAVRYRSYLVTAPSGINFSLAVDPKENQIMITSTDEPGNWRVQAGGQTSGADHGFSVNLALKQTELERLTPDELSELLGPIKFRVARNRGEIERNVSMARVGRELFPLLILLAALILAAEHILANRFYRE